MIAEGRKAHPVLALYLWLVAITGGRRGELCALQVRDVDLVNSRPGDPRISGTSGPGQTGSTGRQLTKGPGLAFRAAVRRLRGPEEAS